MFLIAAACGSEAAAVGTKIRSMKGPVVPMVIRAVPLAFCGGERAHRGDGGGSVDKSKVFYLF